MCVYYDYYTICISTKSRILSTEYNYYANLFMLIFFMRKNFSFLYNLFTQLSSVAENLVKVDAVIYQAFRNIFRQTLTNREIKPSIKRYMTRLSRVIYLLVREYEKSFSYSLFKPFLLVTEQSTDLFRPTSFKRASPPFHLKF